MSNIKIENIENVELQKAYVVTVKGVDADGIKKMEYNITCTDRNIDFNFIKQLSANEDGSCNIGYIIINKIKFNIDTPIKEINGDVFEFTCKIGDDDVIFNVSFKNGDKYSSSLTLPLLYRPFYTNAVLMLLPSRCFKTNEFKMGEMISKLGEDSYNDTESISIMGDINNSEGLQTSVFKTKDESVQITLTYNFTYNKKGSKLYINKVIIKKKNESNLDELYNGGVLQERYILRLGTKYKVLNFNDNDGNTYNLSVNTKSISHANKTITILLSLEKYSIKNKKESCYGRLFYSIVNGCSFHLGDKYYLDNVTLSFNENGGENGGSMVLKSPFRCYSEMEMGMQSQTNADTIGSTSKMNKMMMYGITEPFIIDNNIIRDGVPVINGEHGINESKINPTANTNYWGLVNLYGEKDVQIFKREDVDKDVEKDVIFDTSLPIDFFFSATEAYPNEEEMDNASKIEIGYSGVQFYSDIKGAVDSKNNKVTYTCEGTTSNNVRYFVLRNDDKNKEVDTILDSICSIKVECLDGASTPKVRCNGLNCNDYIHDGDSNYLNPRIRGYGWKSIHTFLKRGIDESDGKNEEQFNIFLSGKTIDTETNNGTEEATWWNHIDITDDLHMAEANGGSVAIINKGRVPRNYIIGLCDTYTSLPNNEYEEERRYMFSHIKPHTNRFSIIKIYKIF